MPAFKNGLNSSSQEFCFTKDNIVLSENTGKCYLVKQKLVLGIPDSSSIREEKFGERNLKEETIDFRSDMQATEASV